MTAFASTKKTLHSKIVPKTISIKRYLEWNVKIISGLRDDFLLRKSEENGWL